MVHTSKIFLFLSYRKYKDEIEKVKRISYPGPDLEVSVKRCTRNKRKI